MPVKYKLIDKDYRLDERLFSCSARGEAALEYHPDCWTTAKVGGLLVFNTLQDVRDYLQRDYLIYNETLWEVSCVRPVKLPPVRLYTPNYLSDVSIIWKGTYLRAASYNIDHDGWPKGTRAYKSVRLLRPSCLYEEN